MTYELTQEQQLLKATIRKFVDDEVRPAAGLYDRRQDPKECVPWELIEKGLALGLGKSIIPKEYGGSGLSALDMMIVTEELARGDAGYTSTVLSSMHAAHMILHFGTEEQKKKYLTMMATDATNRFLVGAAFTEPQSGSDAMSPDPRAGIQSYARLEGDEYVINGKKCFITNGGIAQLYIVFAKTNLDLGAPQGGLSAFIIPADTPGLKIGKVEDKLGQRLSQQSELILEDCRVSKDQMLGQEGMGFYICIDMVASTFTSVGAIGVGIAQSAFEYAYNYAKERVQGGTAIINHQAISHKLANMLTMLEATRTLVHKSAYYLDNKQPNHLLVPMVKLLASELAFTAANDAVQIFGGYGYTKEYPVEKLLRDARVLSIYESGNEVVKNGIVDIYKMYEQAMHQA